MASSVNLGEKLEATVDKLVSEGRYGSRSEVLREGVRLVEEREAALKRFEAEIQKGWDSGEKEGWLSAEEVFDRLIAKYEKMAARKVAA
jgi:antitoxin ParD1/3/4